MKSVFFLYCYILLSPAKNLFFRIIQDFLCGTAKRLDTLLERDDFQNNNESEGNETKRDLSEIPHYSESN